MNKKNLLFVIHRLNAGGAEKSLVSLLNALPSAMFEIDLLAIDPSGIFLRQVPPAIKVLEPPREMVCMSVKITDKRFWQCATLKLLLVKLRCILGNHLRGGGSKARRSHSQYYNDIWQKHIPNLGFKYDVAISYIDGLNYYVIDHVTAGKKILWCHNDYNKLEFNPFYDHRYYEKADKICTISELCRKSLIENFPDLKDKFEVIENISSPRMINVQADMCDEMESAKDGFILDKRFKIVSIGRLTEQKGFDFAIDAAEVLKNRGLDFCWYILGEGPLRKVLESAIQAKGLSDNIKFIGIRSNPYPYIKRADVFAMPSRYEGKSIALDEAKILHKPIVVTNYPSVYDAVENKITGLIVEMNGESIASGIQQLHDDAMLRDALTSELGKHNYGNEKQVISSFLDLIK